VKPAIIILSEESSEEERAFLTDFGLSKHAQSGTLTIAGQVVGTFDYLPPEQIENRPLDAGRISIHLAAFILGTNRSHLSAPPGALSF